MIQQEFIQLKRTEINYLYQLISTPVGGFINAMHLRWLIRRNPLDALLIYITSAKRKHPDAPIMQWIKENIRTSPYLNN